MEQLSTHIYLETKWYQTKQRAHLVFLDLLFLYYSCNQTDAVFWAPYYKKRLLETIYLKKG